MIRGGKLQARSIAVMKTRENVLDRATAAAGEGGPGADSFYIINLEPHSSAGAHYGAIRVIRIDYFRAQHPGFRVRFC